VWTLPKLLYLPVVFTSQVICFAALFIMGSTLTFWTMQPIEAVNIVTYGGTEMMTYPMSIYPQWARRFFTYIIPFIFMNYYPALYFLNKPDPFEFPGFAPFIAPFAAAALFLLALTVWRFGIRHYQGAGS
jgi:ABC-2 type transport system permease protein